MRRRPLARPWRRGIGERRQAGSLAPGATGTDLTLTGALGVGGAAAFDGAADFDGAVDMSAGLTMSAGVLLLANGTAGAPSLAFAGSPTDGWYETAGGIIRLAIGGSNVLSWTATAISSSLGLDLGSYLTLNNESTPATLGADQNNYSINASASALRLAATVANVNITGLSGPIDGRVIPIVNVGASNTITLKHESASSTAANRFALRAAADIVLDPGDAALIWYDGTSSRNRAIGVAI